MSGSEARVSSGSRFPSRPVDLIAAAEQRHGEILRGGVEGRVLLGVPEIPGTLGHGPARWFIRSEPPKGSEPLGPLLVLLVQALWERELRRAMARRQAASLPMYPEGRACRCPTTPRLIELFENVQRHRAVVGKKPPVILTTKLSRLQRRILGLLGMRMVYDN